MNEQALTDEAMGYFVEGDPRYPQIIGLDDLLAAAVVAAIAAAVSWMVKKCLNSSFNEHKLRRLVRWGCKQGAASPAGTQLGLTAESMDERYGDRMAFALIKTHDRVRPRLICGGMPDEHPMPEDA